MRQHFAVAQFCILLFLVLVNGACSKRSARLVSFPDLASITIPPHPSTTPTPSLPPAQSTLVTVWANDGADKVTQDERRAILKGAASVTNSAWNGSRIAMFGARNEVVAFNLILETGDSAASNLSISFPGLASATGEKIASNAATGNDVFKWVNRNIEIFLVRYLPIRGLSKLSYETYDERHVPRRLQRPWSGAGLGTGGWNDRPDHDKFYPDIAVPLEAVGNKINIPAKQNQSIWVDVYVPKAATPGIYSGAVVISQAGSTIATIPVDLTVRKFTLPDLPTAKTMVVVNYPDVAMRYTGTSYPTAGAAQDVTVRRVRDRHFLMAHRHKISLIDNDPGAAAFSGDRPRDEWIPRLDGSLFSATNGYDGPGVGVSNNVYSIGTYGQWSWKSGTETDMRQHTDAWETWFASYAPDVEHFLYLIDESTNYAQTEQWAQWIHANPGIGHNLMSFATVPIPTAVAQCPSLDIAASWFGVGSAALWKPAVDKLTGTAGKRAFMYNGRRPSQGSFAIEDDGVALRELAWAQYKKNIGRWFFWESTYYNNYQGGRGQTNVFRDAQTFGGAPAADPVLGQTGWNYSNGDGLLFYPGTDKVFPVESYGLEGPLASLRLKHWRRGIQDVDYLKLAAVVNPAATQTIVDRMVPKAMWDYGVNDPNDPTWVRTDISWSINPNDWEAARSQLADLIEAGRRK